VYGIDDPREICDYYDSWADTYDAELIENGYASPRRVAAALAAHDPDLTAPVLDYGCGTGMSGDALRAAGFSVVDGADPSPEMLRVAEAKEIYRSLVQLDLDVVEPPFARGSYATVAAIGLIGPGAAPLALFDQLLDLVQVGGLFGLSLNDHALADPAYPAKIREHTSAGAAEVVFEEHGPHLPGLGVESTVFVLRRSTRD
jgi:predicted TPR repeat methyltransferase